MPSARQDRRAAVALVFMEVCLASLRKHSRIGEREKVILDDTFKELERAWKPINTRRCVPTSFILSRNRSLNNALVQVWGRGDVDGRAIVAGLMDLAERVWDTGAPETRQAWDRMTRLLNELLVGAVSSWSIDDDTALEVGQTLADIVDRVALQGQSPAWAVRVCMEDERKRLKALIESKGGQYHARRI